MKDLGDYMKRLLMLWVLVMVVKLPAQYQIAWEVAQDYYESGLIYFDLNSDGVPEITKFWWNTVTAYDGANNYQLLWQVYAPDYDKLLLWDLYSLNSDSSRTAIFIQSNVIDTVTTSIMAKPVLSSNTLWVSSEYHGYVTFLDAGDLDQDGTSEVVFGTTQYRNSDSSFVSFLHILDGSSGVEEWTSDTLAGTLLGPYLGDLEGDGLLEILVNIYQPTDTTSVLRAYRFIGGNSTREVRSHVPQAIQLGPARPNPFNPYSIIPLELSDREPVRLVIVDLQGREVNELVNGVLAPGRYLFTWDGRDRNGRQVASGIYYWRLTTPQGVKTRPVVLVK